MIKLMQSTLTNHRSAHVNRGYQTEGRQRSVSCDFNSGGRVFIGVRKEQFIRRVYISCLSCFVEWQVYNDNKSNYKLLTGYIYK